MPTKCCWVIHGSLTSERKASTSPSSFINHSTLLLNRALKRQAPCLVMHFEVRALDRLRGRARRRVGSTRRRGNHMHDHSRFQRDINDVTGVSLSLYLSQKSLTHNIGSASALPIIIASAEALALLCGSFARRKRERERERERDRDRQTDRQTDGSDVTVVALNLAMFTLSLAKNSHFSFLPSHFPSKWSPLWR